MPAAASNQQTTTPPPTNTAPPTTTPKTTGCLPSFLGFMKKTEAEAEVVLKFTEAQIAQMKATIIKYGADAEKLLVEGGAEVEVLSTEGVTLINGLISDLGVIQEFLQDTAVAVPALSPDLAPAITALIAIQAVLTGAIAALKIEENITADISATASAAQSGNTVSAKQSVGHTLSDLTTGLTAAVHAGILPKTVNTTTFFNAVNGGLTAINKAYNDIQPLAQVVATGNKLQVTRSPQSLPTPQPNVTPAVPALTLTSIAAKPPTTKPAAAPGLVAA